MTSDITHNAHPEKRSSERIQIRKMIELETTNGDLIRGETENSSLGGMLIHSLDNLDNLLLGSRPSLYLIIDSKRSRAFPCQIIRISKDTIGVSLDKKSALALATLLRKDIR